MLKQGKGKIINVASLLSFQGGITVPAYAASKGAVAQFTKTLSNEWAGKGVNVNAIAPGYMATEMNTALMEDRCGMSRFCSASRPDAGERRKTWRGRSCFSPRRIGLY